MRLTTPYLDTSADQLSFSLTTPARDALAVTAVGLGGVTVELRLLGASHQVLAGPVTETLACLPGSPGGGPPAVVTEEIDGWAYRFTSELRHHEWREFAVRTARLRAELAAHPASLYGTFPGSPDAISALAVLRTGDVISWRTWHTYPQAGQIVETRTMLRVPGEEAEAPLPGREPETAGGRTSGPPSGPPGEQKGGGGASAQAPTHWP
ncbi:DUF2617 family protein [Streptomyces sp. NBC_01803]|uniref:DUF2617 family protein n=1 Tax=Streptomyces sp. NBC_01803 TaxID=2975946 RepID=UPI002DD9B820|nr:DUF2617 family protein [Streptomyces sp. NBC_01803]WSA46305.1 DUF2617 family protein [Streptomyces sp. NBC_01803]